MYAFTWFEQSLRTKSFMVLLPALLGVLAFVANFSLALALLWVSWTDMDFLEYEPKTSSWGLPAVMGGVVLAPAIETAALIGVLKFCVDRMPRLRWPAFWVGGAAALAHLPFRESPVFVVGLWVAFWLFCSYLRARIPHAGMRTSWSEGFLMHALHNLAGLLVIPAT